MARKQSTGGLAPLTRSSFGGLLLMAMAMTMAVMTAVVWASLMRVKAASTRLSMWAAAV